MLDLPLLTEDVITLSMCLFTIESRQVWFGRSYSEKTERRRHVANLSFFVFV